MIILNSENALENADLTAAYLACKQDVDITARFKKKEDLLTISKSILKHRIQTLTGRNIKKIEEEMDYKPVDPNETGMNFDVMKRLAHCLILLANGELEKPRPVPVPEPAETTFRSTPSGVSKKRALADSDAEVPKAKVGRRSLAVVSQSTTEESTPTLKRGRKSIATPLVTEQASTPNRSSRRSVATAVTPPRSSRKSAKSGLNDSNSSEASVAVRCLGPAAGNEEKLQDVEEAEEEEEEAELDETMSNPTPAMKELMKKRKSMGKQSPVKKAAKAVPKKTVTAVAPPPAPKPPRPEFVGAEGSRIYLLCGDPLDLKLEKLNSALPLSFQFPGAHLSVVHTPSDWTPRELAVMTRRIKTMNKSAGLDSFVVLFGTGLHDVQLNTDAIRMHTKHVQFVTFHNENANKDKETGMLRETTSFFLAGYFFPGCELEGYQLTKKLVRDGYTDCFRCTDVASLEKSIVDCFSEKGEFVMDFYTSRRKLILTAAEMGRNGLSVDINAENLEGLGDFVRTLSLNEDKTYREEDGLVLPM